MPRASYLRAKEAFFAKCPLDLLANTLIFNESVSDCTKSCPLDRSKELKGAQLLDFIEIIQRTSLLPRKFSGKSNGHPTDIS